MPEYQCCLCGIINSNCTRKCFTCGSKERRICDRCCASRNKCLECQDESSNGQKIATDDGAATPKKKRSVSFADHDDCSSVNSRKSAKSSRKTKGSQEEEKEEQQLREIREAVATYNNCGAATHSTAAAAGKKRSTGISRTTRAATTSSSRSSRTVVVSSWRECCSTIIIT